jgi:hypothetical protein
MELGDDCDRDGYTHCCGQWDIFVGWTDTR